MIARSDLRIVPSAVALWACAVVGILGGTRALIVLLLALTSLVVLGAIIAGRASWLRAAGGHLGLLGLGLILLVPAVLEQQQGREVFSAAQKEGRVVEVRVTADGDAEPVVRSAPWSSTGAQVIATTEPGVLRAGRDDRDIGENRVLVTAEETLGAELLEVSAGQSITVRGSVVTDGRLIILRASSLDGSTPPQGYREMLRDGARSATAGLPDDEGALVRGMTTGDTHGLSPATEEVMRRAGISHLVAVSGANIAIVLAAVLVPLLILGVPRRPRILLAALAAAGYLVLVGGEPSVLRAATMAAPLLIARFVGVRSSVVSALALAVALWSALDPATAASVGFVLSALATAAIVILSPPLSRTLRSMSGDRLPEPWALFLAVPLVAQGACTPVLLLLAPEVSLWAVPVNMLVAPIVGPTTILGILAVVAGAVSPPLATSLYEVAAGGAHLVLIIARTADSLPGSRIPVPGGPGGAILAVLALLAAAAALWMRRRRVVRWTAAAVIVAVIAPPLALRVPLDRAGDWIIAACAIGQGDAVVLRSASSRATILVDTGPEPAALRGCLDRLGVTSIDLLILTHPHADHTGGRSALTGARVPGEQWVCPLPTATAQTVPGPAARAVVAGEEWTADGLTLEVLWPPDAGTAEEVSAREEGGGEGEAANDCSVVVAAQWDEGPRYIGLGDLEPVAQSRLLDLAPGPADVVKIAHHGSARQDPALYEHLDPGIMLITAGAENSYGHPRPESIELSERLAEHVGRTDRHGTILVPIDPQSGLRGVGGPR